MGFIGADVEELDELAQQLDAAAGRIGQIHAEVRKKAHGSGWEGPDAEQFYAEWDGRCRGLLRSAADRLGDSATILRRQADDQRRVSEASDRPDWANRSGLLGLPGRLRWELMGPDQRWAATDGRDALTNVASRSPEEQAAWWGSLTPGQQAALIAQQPLLLLGLQGLPADARRKASEQAVKDMDGSINVVEESVSLEAGATIKVVKLGVDSELRIQEFADGHVEVTVSAGGDVGAGLKKVASVGVHGGVESTYSFPDRAAADAFVDGLIKSPTPDDKGDYLQAVNPFTGGPAGYTADEVVEYLGKHEAIHTVYSIEAQGSVGANFGSGKLDVDVAGGTSYDSVTGETTYYVKGSADVMGSIGPYAGTVGVDGDVALVLDRDGNVSELQIAGSFEAAGGEGSVDKHASALVGAGMEGRFNATVDLQDPANRAAAEEFVRATAGGDAGAAKRAFDDLRDGSQVVVQGRALATTRSEFDAKVVSASAEVTASTAVTTYVKPPHGDFVQAGGRQ